MTLRTTKGHAAIVCLTCFRPLSQGAHAEAIDRGAANPAWRETKPGYSEGVPHALGDCTWRDWLEYIRPNLYPPGIASATVRIYNRPTWEAYTLGFAQARLIGARYVMVIEDDVYIPPETVRRLYAVLEENPQAGAACGVYWWRRQPRDPDFPQLYRPARAGHREGHGGPWMQYPQDQIIEVGAGGLGCMMVRMSALQAAEQHGPLFLETWEGTDGITGHGGDLCMQHRLQQAGYAILADTSLRAWHRDPYCGVWFPHDTSVRHQYGWSEWPLEGFGRDLQGLSPGLIAQMGPKPTKAAEYGQCSLCPPGSPQIHATEWDAHVAAAHANATAEPITVSPTSAGRLLGVPADSSRTPIPALRLDDGVSVHPDFRVENGAPQFAWDETESGIAYGLVYGEGWLDTLGAWDVCDSLGCVWALVRPGGRLYLTSRVYSEGWIRQQFEKAGIPSPVITPDDYNHGLRAMVQRPQPGA